MKDNIILGESIKQKIGIPLYADLYRRVEAVFKMPIYNNIRLNTDTLDGRLHSNIVRRVHNQLQLHMVKY